MDIDTSIKIGFVNAVIVGVAWLLMFSSKAVLPFPGEYVAFPLAVTAFLITVAILPGRPQTDRVSE